MLLAAGAGSAAAQSKHGSTAPTPPPPPPPDPGPQTQAALDAQNKRIDDLEAQLAKAAADAAAAQQSEAALAKALDAEKQARLAAENTAAKASADAEAAAKAKTAPPPSVQSAWDHLALTGFLQADLAMRQSSEDQLNDSTHDPLNEDRFSLRRARLKLTADYGAITGALELDANTTKGAQVRPVGAELDYTPRAWASGTIGLFKIPFGYEVMQSDRDRLFLERSTAERALFPGEYDLGARASGKWRFLRYAIAAQNGEPIGEKSGYALRDPNGAKDYTAHAGVETAVSAVKISGGASVLTGTGLSPGTPATKDVLVWRDLNEDGVVGPGEIQVIAGSAATPSTNFDRFAVGADLEGAWKGLTIYGEVVVAKNLDRGVQVADPIAAKRDLRELGFYLAATEEIGDRGIVGARFDFYNPDSDSSEIEGGVVVPKKSTYSTIALTAGLRFEHAKLIVEGDLNKNHNGRDATGKPVNLKDDAITLRGELDF